MKVGGQVWAQYALVVAGQIGYLPGQWWWNGPCRPKRAAPKVASVGPLHHYRRVSASHDLSLASNCPTATGNRTNHAELRLTSNRLTEHIPHEQGESNV